MTKNLKIFLIVLGVILVGSLVALAFQSSEPVEDVIEAEKPELDEPVVDEETDENADWETYRNEEYGFAINYPANSTKEEKEAQLTTEFRLSIEGEVSTMISVGYDQVGYDGRINNLKRGDIIEGTTTPLLEEVVIEEGVVDGAKESFKASYIRNTYNEVNDTMEREEVVELYALDSYAYIMSCKKDMDKCKEILSTFRLL